MTFYPKIKFETSDSHNERAGMIARFLFRSATP